MDQKGWWHKDRVRKREIFDYAELGVDEGVGGWFRRQQDVSDCQHHSRHQMASVATDSPLPRLQIPSHNSLSLSSSTRSLVHSKNNLESRLSEFDPLGSMMSSSLEMIDQVCNNRLRWRMASKNPKKKGKNKLLFDECFQEAFRCWLRC